MRSFLIILFLFLGCSEKVVYPKWFKNPPEDKNYIIYATGEGIDKTSAINDALTQIANRISTSISSEMFIYQGFTQNNKNIDTFKSVQKQILQKINNFHFYDYKILKMKNINKRDYVTLVAVDKNKNAKLIIDNNKNKLNLLIEKFDNIKSPLQKIKFAKKSIKIINENILPELFIAKILGENSNYLINKAQNFLITLQYYLQNIKVSLNANKYFNILAQCINFPISQNSNLAINMNIKENYQKVYDEYIVQIKAFITIKYQNNILLSKEVIAVKSSYVNYTISKKLALEELKKKLKETFIEIF